MKRKTSAQTLILALLLFLILDMPSLQVTNGYSQTFQLTPETFSSRPLVELQVGDRIEGSFLISNLGPYRNMLNGESVYYWIGVDFKNPNGQTILNYTNYPEGRSSFGSSFNYTAVDWGDYSLWIFCGGNFAFENAKYPEMTIDFTIVKAKMPEPPNPDIMAWWKLNEGNGIAVLDSSWNNRQGTIVGANWTNVNENNFLNFNGESDYVKLPSLPLADLDALTVSAWINSDLTKNGFIIYHGNKGEFQLGNGDFVEDKNSELHSNYANFSVKLSDAKWYSVSSSSPMKPNTWHHLVGVWVNGTSLKVYIDGVLAGENYGIPPARLFDAGGSFPSSLGVRAQTQYAWDNPCFFKGIISNVMVYNKALNSQEIDNLTTQIAESLSIPKPSYHVNEPFLTYLFITSVVTAIVVGIALLIYFKKRKH
jgi:hypothetical protein